MRSSRVLDRTLSKAVGRQELLSDSRIIAKSDFGQVKALDTNITMLEPMRFGGTESESLIIGSHQDGADVESVEVRRGLEGLGDPAKASRQDLHLVVHGAKQGEAYEPAAGRSIGGDEGKTFGILGTHRHDQVRFRRMESSLMRVVTVSDQSRVTLEPKRFASKKVLIVKKNDPSLVVRDPSSASLPLEGRRGRKRSGCGGPVVWSVVIRFPGDRGLHRSVDADFISEGWRLRQLRRRRSSFRDVKESLTLVDSLRVEEGKASMIAVLLVGSSAYFEFRRS
ncbi:unnamed protein product [Brassica oleracea var. botrytis]|uniref:(rape) hypothetical protein n=1 Tax=Brassica napus TaxID=3708 RepID=A0A816RDL4_BRANA|nr:unnamed protein product [Brassica napus]